MTWAFLSVVFATVRTVFHSLCTWCAPGTYSGRMASIVEKRLCDGSRAYLVRFRTADGQQRSKQFKRKREADAYVSVVEVDRMSGALIDPRLGRITVAEWWDQWWPTVTNLRASTRARDAQFYKSHIRPAFGDTPLNKLDRTSLRSWLARLGSPHGANLAPATIHKVVQILNKTVNAAFEDRLIPHNPVAKLPLPKSSTTRCASSRRRSCGDSPMRWIRAIERSCLSRASAASASGSSSVFGGLGWISKVNASA